MIGIDILQISRFMDVVKRRGLERLSNRILSQKEKIEYEKANNKEMFIAVRFSAKESAYKALYPTKKTFKDLSIFKIDSKPFISDGSTSHFLSISHDGDYLITFVMLQGYGKPNINV